MARPIRDPQVHDHVNNSFHLVPFLYLISPLHTVQSNLFKFNFNIIFPCGLWSSNGLFPSGLPTKTLYAPLHSPIRAICSDGNILPNFIALITSSDKYKSGRSSLCRSIPFPPSYSHVYHSAPYFESPSAYVLLLMQETKFHTHVKHQNIRVYIFACIRSISTELCLSFVGGRRRVAAGILNRQSSATIQGRHCGYGVGTW